MTTTRKQASLLDYVRLARIDHWIKNLFIVPGAVVAALIFKTPPHSFPWLKLLLGLVATSLAASANYVINEWLDARFDRFHPTKKSRPVVVSQIRGTYVLLEYGALIIASLLLAATINKAFAGALVWLLAMGVIYNVEPLRTKDIPHLDVLSESINNMIRLLLGWFILAPRALPPSSILLGYWMGGAFLMAAKRFAEYRMIGDPALAGNYRRSFRFYTEPSLLISAVCYAMISLFFVGVFLLKYKIELLLAVPFLIAMFCKYLAISYKEDSAAQKPEKLYREKGLMVWCTAFVAVLALSLVLRLPWLDSLLDNKLVHLPF